MQQEFELMFKRMREELTGIGIKELTTPADVESELKDSKGTLLVFVNSVCGCAGGSARPGLAMALKNAKRPERLTTVFAGQDKEATAKAREFITDYAPSSPSAALFKDGKLVYFMPRHNIEGRTPQDVASQLTTAFNQHC
ncbi:MAG: BrxA/BrxB family bacilliredoxin [Planctomycetes bacterium]|nr:BrxA/BrxB family bacilliredoxin [Planctomycetota bacterium]